jgi:hypothetical protein
MRGSLPDPSIRIGAEHGGGDCEIDTIPERRPESRVGWNQGAPSFAPVDEVGRLEERENGGLV